MSRNPAHSTAFEISQFDKAKHNRSTFSCGFDPIDRFLKKALTDHIKVGYLTAYMATEEGADDVIGFYTLSAFAVSQQHIEPPKRPRPPPTIPTIYLKAVAVHSDWQGKGLGQALMVHALRQALRFADSVGAMAVVLDVLRDPDFERRLAFYTHLGFRSLNDPDNPDRIYISMADIRATLGS